MQKYKMPISRLRMMVCLIGMLLPMCMFAQQITVQGVVKDQTGETVIGASVMEKCNGKRNHKWDNNRY